MIFTILVIVTAALLFLHLAFNYNAKARALRKIPGPKGVFILGDALHLLKSSTGLFKMARDFAQSNNGIYKFWSCPVGSVNIYNPEDIEVILSSVKYINKGVVYKFLRPWLREGLLVSRGDKWLHRRKILTPAFHFNILRHFTTTFGENSKAFAKNLEKCCGDENIDLTPILANFSLNSICETAMGTRLDDELVSTGKSYKQAIYDLTEIILMRMLKSYYFSDRIFNMSSFAKAQAKCIDVVKNFTKKVINDRKDFIEKNNLNFDSCFQNDKVDKQFLTENKLCMLDLLLTAKKKGLIEDEGIQEEVDTFTFEGHDTTAAALTFLFMLLANHKDAQDKIFTELTEIFEHPDQPGTMKDLNKMKYLECCIKESLRLYPPVHFISRSLRKPVVLSNYTVPEKVCCNIHIYDLHRREDLFEKANEFIPERFYPENSIGRHPYSYIPFSAGPRNCIGQKYAILQMKSVVSEVLRRFELHPVTKPSDIAPICDIVLRNEGPVCVKFEKRQKTI